MTNEKEESKFMRKDEYKVRMMLEERRVFLTHFMLYLAFSVMFVIVNLKKTPDIIWCVYPIGAWGCGIALHFISAVLLFDAVYERMENRIREYIEKEKKK